MPADDPIQRPARMSRVASTSLLVGVARAGDRLVAVGPRGHILVGHAQAANLRQTPAPASVDLVAVRFIDAHTGYAVGHDGVVLRTDDGGSGWRIVLDGPRAAEVVRRAHGPGSGGEALPGPVLADIEQAGMLDKPLLDASFADAGHGVVVGAFGLALQTEDGGRSWTSLMDRTDNPEAYHFYGAVRHGDDLFLVGERGLIRRWSAAARRFERVVSPYAGSWFGALSAGGTLYLYGLRGHVFASRDRGATWEPLRTDTTASITGATVLPDGRALFVTQGGQLLQTDAGGLTLTAQRGTRPMPYAAVAAVDARTVAVVGTGGIRTETLVGAKP